MSVYVYVCVRMCINSRVRPGRHHESSEEEAEDKALVADELEQSEQTTSWPTHMEAQPTSVLKPAGMIMRDYQLEALNWLIRLHDQNLNGILADEMVRQCVVSQCGMLYVSRLCLLLIVLFHVC